MTDPSCWKVVITDDDPDTLQIIQRLLASYGAEVYTTTKGDDCLWLLREKLPTLLLLRERATPQPGVSARSVAAALV